MKKKSMKGLLIRCVVILFVIILTSNLAYAQKLIAFNLDAKSNIFMSLKLKENGSTVRNLPHLSIHQYHYLVEKNVIEYHQRSKNNNEPKIIPGLTAANIKSILEKNWGVVFSGPQKGKLLLHDSGETIDSNTGVHLICDIYETSPQKVQWVNFIVDASSVMGLVEVDQITKVTERYFSSCATISYDGANPTKAKQWVAKNVWKAVKPGELSTQIGKAEIKLFGTEYMRTLQITPIGGATPLY